MAQAQTFMANLKKLEAVRQGNKKAAREVFPWLMNVFTKGVGGGKRDVSVRPYVALVWYTLHPDMGTRGHRPPSLKKIPASRHQDKMLYIFDKSDALWRKAVNMALEQGWLLHDHAYRPGEVWIRHRSVVDGADVFKAPTATSDGEGSIFSTLLMLAGGIIAIELIEKLTGRRVKSVPKSGF